MAQQPGASVSLLQRSIRGVKSYFGSTITANGTLVEEQFVSRLLTLLGGRPTYTGKSINDTTAMQISTVWSCVRILSETIGALPWAIYERDDRGNAKKIDHELGAVLLDQPNSDMTSQEFRESKVLNLALRGNGYSEIFRNGRGAVTSVYPMPACYVQPEREPGGAIVYRFHHHGGKVERLPAEKVWHVKGFGSNGLVGLSPIAYAAQAMGLSLTLEEFAAKFFANGARVSGLIKSKEWLTDKQRPIAKALIDEMWQGMDNAHKAKLLEGGMEYEQLSVPPDEAQFLESRKLSVTEICRFYRIPPHMVADLERATFSNIEQQSLEFVQFTLLPWLVRIEQSASRRLFSAADRRRFFLRFNFEGLLRADSSARASLYSVLLQNGVLNRNEARALENMPYSTDEGMNEFTVQSNMALIDQIAALVTSRSAPKPAPVGASA